MNIFEEKKKMISGYKKKSDELLVQFKEDEKRIKLLEGKSYREWLKNLSLAEGALKEKIYELNEKLFADLTFEDLLEEDTNNPGDCIMQPLDIDPLHHTRYIINSNLKVLGKYDPMDNTITFHPDHLLDEHITHEMLHVYEYFYDKNPLMKDFWITRLYSRLRPRVKKLDGYCCQLGLMSGKVLDNHFGQHGILFLLKSLDLDIRLNLPLGRVFGYSEVLVFER